MSFRSRVANWFTLTSKLRKTVAHIPLILVLRIQRSPLFRYVGGPGRFPRLEAGHLSPSHVGNGSIESLRMGCRLRHLPGRPVAGYVVSIHNGFLQDSSLSDLSVPGKLKSPKKKATIHQSSPLLRQRRPKLWATGSFQKSVAPKHTQICYDPDYRALWGLPKWGPCFFWKPPLAFQVKDEAGRQLAARVGTS